MHAFFSTRCRAAGFAVLACAFTALMPAVASADGASCAGADIQPGQASAAELGAATVCLMNAERTSRGLQPLRRSATLETGAARYAGTMVSQGFFSHTDRSGGNVATRLQDEPGASVFDEFGENLGWGSYHMATPRSIVQGWMESPAHRENVLYSRFDEVGIGIALGAPGANEPEAATYTGVFGDHAPATFRTARKTSSKRALPRACRGKRAKTARGKRACRRAKAAQRARARR
jgi:uncharacterized protein YkwD